MKRVLAVALMTTSSMAWATLQMPEIMIVDDGECQDFRVQGVVEIHTDG
ncbi:hypothetical protein [Ralstonia solanacearum]|nr:hypothetical protein [Ralstonia solanacearum]MDC6179305.1 hypothetical protein [Ralstonia solanacearum]MDC6208938.1 hypothetical protein [Ralstonia solanacearum]MDC6239196.1 hypothetical protein [Ralstonia solanacearum]MDD7803447.1 hypothetical protein [Ralstonia solanacearum]